MDIKKVRRNDKVGAIDSDSMQIIVPAIYDDITICSHWIIAWKNPRYDEVLCGDLPSDGKSFVFDMSGHRFFLSYNGERVEGTILLVTSFDKDLYKAKARVNGVIVEGLFNEAGEMVIPFIYEKIMPLDYESFFGEYQMTQLLYKVGKEVKYEWDWDRRSGKIKQAKWGIINQEGIVMFPLEYDHIGSVGGCVYPSELSDLSDFYGKFIIVTEATKTGLFKRDGTEILPIQFTYIGISENKFVRYYVGGERIKDNSRDYCTGGFWGIGHIQNGLYSSPKYDAVVFTNEIPGIIAKAVQGGVAGTISENLLFVENSKQSAEEVKDILHESNVFWEREIEYHDYGWTQAELDEMYRAAYENDPDATWNNY